MRFGDLSSWFCWCVGWSICVAVLGSVQAYAADPLRLELSPVTTNIRSDAPLAVKVHLDWASPNLLEGRLELNCYDGQQLILRHIGSDVAMMAGDRFSQTILPPMSLDRDLSVLTVKARFVAESKTFDLGSHDLRVPVHWKRAFVIGVVVPYEGAPARRDDQLGQELRLDQLGTDEIRDNRLTSIPSLVSADDLRSGLELFAYDVLVLTERGFDSLSSEQLQAVGQWGEAGGSLFVLVGKEASKAQSAFLNQVAGLTDNDPRSVRGSDTLPEGGVSSRSGNFQMYRPGFGRTVLIRSDDFTNGEPNLKEAAAFLWKVRSEIQSDFRLGNTSNVLTTRLAKSKDTGSWRPGMVDDTRFRDSPFQHVPLDATENLTAILLPDEVQTIPLSTVAIILVLFLVMIVPVDYYLLGYLKNRRWTWAFLPVVSLLFTGMTVWLGNQSLGTTDYRTSLEIVDLAAGPRAIRNSRFEMLFTATHREATTELKRTLHTLMAVPRNTNDFNVPARVNSANRPVAFDEDEKQTSEIPVPLYEGTMPAQFTVRQLMRKWSPQISRETRLSIEGDQPPFDLDVIETAWQETPELIDDAEWCKSLHSKLTSALPDAAETTVLLLRQDQVVNLMVDSQDPDKKDQEASGDARHRMLVDFVRQVCVRPAIGLFSVVSQISPNSAGNFEDLTILDPENQDQLLLVVVTRQGNNHVVYRRLFQRGS